LENGYNESFNDKLHDEFLSGDIIYSLREPKIVIEQRRKYYITNRPPVAYAPKTIALGQSKTMQQTNNTTGAESLSGQK